MLPETAQLAAEAAEVVASNMEAIEMLKQAAHDAEKQAAETIRGLRARVGDLEVQVKAATGFVPSDEEVGLVADHMVRLGFILANEKQAAGASLRANPAKLINVVDRMASHISSPLMAAEGSPIKQTNTKFAGQSGTKVASPWY
jgi:hypothetical protein